MPRTPGWRCGVRSWTASAARWLELDPTNNLLPSDRHIRLAVGRDYGDVAPLRGVIRGGGDHQLSVEVSTSDGRVARTTCEEQPHEPRPPLRRDARALPDQVRDHYRAYDRWLAEQPQRGDAARGARRPK